MSNFLSVVGRTTYASKAVAALPSTDNTPPNLASFVTYYFKAMNKPVPRMTDGVTEGFLHTGSRVEVLFVEMTHTDWCLLAVWVNENFTEHIFKSHQVRCYADRVDTTGVPYVQRIRGKKYLTLISSPYETKQVVRSHLEDIWRVRVEVLYYDPAPRVVEVKRHPMSLLTSRTPEAPKSFTPKPLTPPVFKQTQGGSQ